MTIWICPSLTEACISQDVSVMSVLLLEYSRTHSVHYKWDQNEYLRSLSCLSLLATAFALKNKIALVQSLHFWAAAFFCTQKAELPSAQKKTSLSPRTRRRNSPSSSSFSDDDDDDDTQE